MDKKVIRAKLKEYGYTLITASYHNNDGVIMFNAFDEFGDPYKFSIIPHANYATRVRLSDLVLHKERDAKNMFF